VRVLLVGAKLCAAKGGRLVILCPDGHVAKVLRIARFDALVPIVDNEAAAFAALA
jgi:anti-anti-sigma regulatory factor